jgi:hypothetical protein
MVQSLKDIGAISTAEFSIHMGGYVADYSTIDIGAPDVTKMQNGTSDGAVDFSFNVDFYWSSYLSGFGFGDDPNKNARSFKKDLYFMLDSGSSHIFAPPSIYEDFVMEIWKAFG